MEAKTVKLSKIKVNPENPRVLKDWKFDKLKKSIKDFPEMMELREIVVDENMTILGGNMRYRAMQDLGIKECPVKIATGLTEEQKREFVIKDNLSYGEWDMDELANNWDDKLLEDWGFEMPDWGNLENEKETKELIDFNRSHILISYNPSKHIELQDILTELMKISGIEIELSSN